jgi:HD-GYP domain-containing protein (c-di-GMP phosphodiesterase class II)
MIYQMRRWLSPFCPYRSKDPFAERRANITAVIFLVLLMIIPVGVLVRFFVKDNFYPPDFIILAATFLAYLSTRTRYYSAGAVFLIFVMCFVTYSAAARHIESGTQDVTSWLVWFVLPLLATPLLFSWRAMIGVAPVPAIFLLVFILQEHPANWGALIAVLTTGAFMSIAIAYAYESDLRLIQEQNKKLLFAYDETLHGWAKILEMRDKETEGHSERVTELTVKLAQAMGVQDTTQLQFIRYGSLLHDIGKIAIPDSILRKPDTLTANERKVMELHTEYAYEWLKDVEFLQPALDIPRYHHEKWDGSGYNHGLKGEKIPLSARIFAVADTWDALMNDRTYRKAWTRAQAIEYIESRAGIDFDPQVVEKFLEIIRSESFLPASESSSPSSA